MKNIEVAHAIVFSSDLENVFFEKNKRFDWKLTFFWWKIEEWEDKIDAIIRELYEEIWITFSRIDFIEFIINDELIIEDIRFIWTIYILLITNSQIDKLLSNPKNISIQYNDISDENFAFWDIIRKIKSAYAKIFN
jgi:8-oxo-dGTP pyrophosphatase MutT (NUDIX family)